MTLSADFRSNNRQRALRALFENLEDGCVGTVLFSKSDFPDVLATTWKDIEDESWIQRLYGQYVLTSNGLREALRAPGKIDDEQLKARLGRLCGTLKAYVKDRDEDAVVSFPSLVQLADLPEGFVFNAIECDLFELILDRKGASWCNGMKGFAVTIPVNFGHPW